MQRYKKRYINASLYIYLTYPTVPTAAAYNHMFGTGTYFPGDGIQIAYYDPETHQEVKLPVASYRGFALSPQDCDEDHRAFMVAQGRGYDSDLIKKESDRIRYLWPFELEEKTIKLPWGITIKILAKRTYPHAVGISYEIWMNFGDNGNKVRSAGTKLKGPTEWLIFETRNVSDYNTALGPQYNFARALDANTPAKVDQILAVMNLFANMAHIYEERIDGITVARETWARDQTGGNRREVVENLQRRIFIEGDSVAIMTLDDMLREFVIRPYAISYLQEYALTEACIETQAGINTREGPIPPRNRWLIPWSVEQRYREDDDIRRDPPVLVNDPNGIPHNVMNPANLDILDRMFRRRFPNTPFSRQVTITDPDNGHSRTVDIVIDDDEKFLRLRRAWFEDHYPEWAQSLTIRLLVEGVDGLDERIDTDRAYYNRGDLNENIGRRYRRRRLNLANPNDRKNLLAIFPLHHAELTRARILGAMHRVKDFTTERLVLREIRGQHWSRAEFARLVLGRDYGVFAREPTYDLVVQDLQRTNQTEREDAHLEAILNPRYENLMAWFLYLADLADIFVNKWSAKLDPTPGTEWWSFGWSEYMSALNGGLLLGYGTQKQQLQVARLLGEGALIVDIFNYLRGITESVLTFPNLVKDVDQLEEWIVQGLISRKIILPWLKVAFVPEAGTFELAVREEPFRVARAAYEWMIKTYYPAQLSFSSKGSDITRRDSLANFDPESSKINPQALFFEDKRQMTRHILGWLQMIFGRIIDPITGEDLFSLMFLPILAGQKPRVQLDMKTLLSFHERDFELIVLDQPKITRPDLHELVRDWLTETPSPEKPRTAPKKEKGWLERLPGPIKSAARFMSW